MWKMTVTPMAWAAPRCGLRRHLHWMQMQKYVMQYDQGPVPVVVRRAMPENRPVDLRMDHRDDKPQQARFHAFPPVSSRMKGGLIRLSGRFSLVRLSICRRPLE